MNGLTTDGERIYAIGDVHGRRDLLDVVLARIEADLEARPHRRPRIVFLGDYVDRGPDSRGVLDRLVSLAAGRVATSFLLGNHDHYLLAYLEDPDWSERGFHWFHSGMGGAATLASYGIPDVTERAPRQGHDEFVQIFPGAHRDFLHGCALSLRVGGYLFVHAGVRPGVPLDRQSPDDLLWIREPFLSSRSEFGAKVVHGHTIVPFVEHRPNRIALDTGAVRTGVLSCLMLEEAEAALLTSAGRTPLPEGAGFGIDGMQRRLGERLSRLLPKAMRLGRQSG